MSHRTMIGYVMLYCIAVYDVLLYNRISIATLCNKYLCHKCFIV